MTFFAPSSITCFFSAVYGNSPITSGSLGVGITLEKGSTATVTGNRVIRVNGTKWKFPTVEYVIEKLGVNCGVEIQMEVPAGCGFGMSGASALATAFEVNDYFGLGMDFWEVADLAHEAEVVCRTGLGDVCCQSLGGVVIRKKACAPSLAVEEIGLNRLDWMFDVDILVKGSLSTKGVLGSSKLKQINKLGRDCLKRFIGEMTLENLFKVSKDFSFNSGLADAQLVEVIKSVEKSGGMAAMVMLGKSVFTYNGFEALKRFGKPFSLSVSKYGVRKVE